MGEDKPGNQEAGLHEDPGLSIAMPEIPGWNADIRPKATPRRFAKVDLLARLRDTQQPPPAASAAPVAPPPVPPAPTGHGPSRLLIILTLIGVVAVAGLATAYHFRTKDRPAVAPAASATPTGKPRPTVRPLPGTTQGPVPAIPPPPAAANRYVVQPGDTLITIAERLGKDWRQIAAANGNIQDPNFITPGQVLTIP